MAERAMSENYAPMAGDVDVEARGGPRRKSAAIGQHRKSTVVVENPELVEGDALNAADRALAEMGYVQVSVPHQYDSRLLTALRALGVQARVLMAIVFFLRFVRVRSVCQCLHDVRLPS
jgi:hypothetical protein